MLICPAQPAESVSELGVRCVAIVAVVEVEEIVGNNRSVAAMVDITAPLVNQVVCQTTLAIVGKSLRVCLTMGAGLLWGCKQFRG